MSDATQPAQWSAFAEALALMPDVYRKLLADHVAAPCGRCRTCTQAGTGLSRTPWPCPTFKMAALARDLHRARVGGVQLRGRPG